MKKTEFSSKTVFPLEKHFYTDMPSSRLNKTTSILEFKNGLYQGDLLDYKRHGKGIYFWDIGQVYIGKLFFSCIKHFNLFLGLCQV